MVKSIRVVGAVVLVAWTGLGALAWYRTKGGVHVTLREGEPEGALPIHLLEDRVAVLTTEVDELVASLGKGFEQVASALEEQASASDRQGARLEQRVRMLEAAVERALTAAPVGGEGVTSAPLAPEVVPALEPAIAVPDEPPPARRSFLAFQIPSRDFRFEGRQTFEIQGDLSRVGFDAKSTLHDFSGVSSAVRGSFGVDLAHPELGIDGRIEIATASLDTGLPARDEAMREHLEGERHAQILFEPTAFAPEAADAEALTLSGRIRGRLTIRGVTRELAMPVTARVDEARRLVIEGEAPLLLPDYAVPVPSQLGLISMEKEVRVWIRLRARPRLAGGR